MIIFVIGGVFVFIVGYFVYCQFIFGFKNEKLKEVFYVGLNYVDKDLMDCVIEELELMVKKYDGIVGGENVQFVFGCQYMEKGQFKKVMEIFEGVKLFDIYLKIYVVGFQGDCFFELGKYEDVIDMYEKVVGMDDNDQILLEYFFKVVLVVEYLGKNDKVIELYEKICDNYCDFVNGK